MRCILLFFLFPLAASAEQCDCHFDTSLDRASLSGSLRVVLKGKRPIGLAIAVTESYVASTDNPLAIWTANLDTTQPSSVGLQRWSTHGATTVLRLSDPGSTSAETLIRVIRTKDGFRVLLDSISGYYRGMARVPTELLLRRGSPACAISVGDR